MDIWYVKFPLSLYNEDVKSIARQFKLKIIDSQYQENNKQCDNAPILTIVGEKQEEVIAKPKRISNAKKTR